MPEPLTAELDFLGVLRDTVLRDSELDLDFGFFVSGSFCSSWASGEGELTIVIGPSESFAVAFRCAADCMNAGKVIWAGAEKADKIGARAPAARDFC